LVRYSVVGSSNANVVYISGINSIEDNISGYWEKDVYVNGGESIGISVKNNEDSELDVRVQFLGRGDWEMYKRVIDKTFVNIKGVIHSTL
jgi:hypothetical protein